MKNLGGSSQKPCTERRRNQLRSLRKNEQPSKLPQQWQQERETHFIGSSLLSKVSEEEKTKHRKHSVRQHETLHLFVSPTGVTGFLQVMHASQMCYCSFCYPTLCYHLSANYSHYYQTPLATEDSPSKYLHSTFLIKVALHN